MVWLIQSIRHNVMIRHMNQQWNTILKVNKGIEKTPRAACSILAFTHTFFSSVMLSMRSGIICPPASFTQKPAGSKAGGH